jgi:hypothetical protein
MPSFTDFLIQAQHETGGWGYATGQRPVVEPTVAILLALRDNSMAQVSFQRGISWLIGSQNNDGGWGIHENDQESGWQTAWALILLNYTGLYNDASERGYKWLQAVGTSDISTDDLLKDEIPNTTSDGALIWPWLPNQVTWIEPTALAVHALSKYSAQSKLIQTRLAAAIRYFKQYRTPSGGWDQGNAGPLDTLVFPRAYQTSLVIMALAQAAPAEILPEDVSGLLLDIHKDQGILAQSAGLLALRMIGKNDDALYNLISQQQLPNGSWDNNPFFTAYASLALRGYL